MNPCAVYQRQLTDLDGSERSRGRCVAADGAGRGRCGEGVGVADGRKNLSRTLRPQRVIAFDGEQKLPLQKAITGAGTVGPAHTHEDERVIEALG